MPVSDAELLQRAIDASELGSGAFARDVLGRDERSVRRWRAGELELPNALRDWLSRVVYVEQDGGDLIIRVTR